MPRLALLLSTFIWGATFPATKAALEQMPPLTFLCVRFLLGTVLVAAWFALVRHRLRREGVDLKLGGIDRFTTVADVIDHFLGASSYSVAQIKPSL